MNKFIEKNRRLLKFYCGAVQIIGGVLIAAGAVWFVMFVCSPVVCSPANFGLADDKFIENILNAASHFSFDFVFVGIAAMMLSQLARYVFDREYKLGLMLRCGDKILYLFAVLGILWAWFRYSVSIEVIGDATSRFLFSQPLLLPTIAKVLILVGLGQLLRRVLSIIKESKTLV